MNKNTIIGSILIAVIVIWWMAVNNANAEAQAAARAKAKATAAQVSKDSSAAGSLVVPKKTPELKAAPVLGGDAKAESPVVADSAVASARRSSSAIRIISGPG